MTETSARFALPHIMPGQAQKEVHHNEALAVIDAALHPLAESIGANVAPGSPAIGECHIVGDTPTGDWSGQAHALAAWSAGGWRFIAPVEGMQAWLQSEGVYARWGGSGWEPGVVTAETVTIGGLQVVGAQQPAIASTAGGNDVRDAVNLILEALRAHGLIAP